MVKAAIQESFKPGAASRPFWTVEGGDEGLLIKAGTKIRAELGSAGCRQEKRQNKIAT